MSSGAHTIENVIAGQAILQTRAKWETVDPILDNPDSMCARSVPMEVLSEPWQISGGVNLKTISCAGCTGSAQAALGQLRTPTDSLTLKRAAVSMTAANKMYWNIAHEGDVAIIGLGGATPAYIANTKSPLAICLDLLFARRGLLTKEQVAALQRQLSSLLANEDQELVASGIIVSPTSLDGLIEFLALHRPDSHPNISVTRDGRFTASWLRGKRAKVTLVFDRDGGDWAGIDLDSRPAVRDAGAFVVNSLAGVTQPFRSWIKA